MTRILEMPILPRDVVRGKRKKFTEDAKASYHAAGEYFQVNLRPRRFTEAHAILAGYAERGKKYEKYKENKFGHRDPLVFSGEARENSAMHSIATVAGTSKAGVGGYAKITYRALQKLNYRANGQDYSMAEEFRRVLPTELGMIGDVYEKKLAERMRRN